MKKDAGGTVLLWYDGFRLALYSYLLLPSTIHCCTTCYFFLDFLITDLKVTTVPSPSFKNLPVCLYPFSGFGVTIQNIIVQDEYFVI